MSPLPSLQGRLLALALGMVALIWLGAAALTWQDASHELDELLDGHLAQTAAQLVAQQGIRDDDDERADVPTTHKYASQVAFQIFRQGTLVAHSANAGRSHLFDVPMGFHTVHSADGLAWRVFATRGLDADSKVAVGEQLRSRQAILWAILRSLLTPLWLALPLLTLALWWAVRRGLAPLRRLSNMLSLRTAHATDALPEDGHPAEIRPLVVALNALLERVAHMLAGERRFNADAAHELRTPIAAIRAQAQVALASDGDAAQRNHALRATLSGCDRAARLVEQLLTLSRLEVAPEADPAPVDLVQLARRIAADLAPGALARKQRLELLGVEQCLVRGNEALLGVLLRNLIDNALRYSPDAAQIHVRIDRVDGQAQVQVADSGPGLPKDDRDRLGERFFRVLGNDQPGSGLGWSIVRRIASVFGLQVGVDADPELGGLMVQLQWPQS